MNGSTRSHATRSLANLCSVVAAIAVNTLAVVLPLNGQNTGEISDRFEVYFTPAGYVFSIWGLIYLMWIAFAVYQVLPAQRRKPRFVALGYWFALSGVFNSAWLVCWHYNRFVASLIVMIMLLATLIVSYGRARIGREPAGIVERLCVDLMFGTYLGWISVATVANAAAVLYWLDWGGWGIAPQMWTLIMLGATLVIGAFMAWVRRDVPFQLVLLWAFVGIAGRHQGPRGLPDAGSVILGAQIAAAAAAGLALVAVARAASTRSSAQGQLQHG